MNRDECTGAVTRRGALTRSFVRAVITNAVHNLQNTRTTAIFSVSHRMSSIGSHGRKELLLNCSNPLDDISSSSSQFRKLRRPALRGRLGWTAFYHILLLHRDDTWILSCPQGGYTSVTSLRSPLKATYQNGAIKSRALCS